MRCRPGGLEHRPRKLTPNPAQTNSGVVDAHSRSRQPADHDQMSVAILRLWAALQHRVRNGRRHRNPRVQQGLQIGDSVQSDSSCLQTRLAARISGIERPIAGSRPPGIVHASRHYPDIQVPFRVSRMSPPVGHQHGEAGRTAPLGHSFGVIGLGFLWDFEDRRNGLPG